MFPEPLFTKSFIVLTIVHFSLLHKEATHFIDYNIPCEIITTVQTLACELTSAPEGDHDVGYTAVDAGESQGSDASPDLQRSCNRIVHFSRRHVRSVILNPVGGKETQTAIRSTYGRVCGDALTPSDLCIA